MEGLEIKYNGNPIKNLAVTRIVIWNKGRDPIKREDIAPKDPIAIHFREDVIGDPTVSPPAQTSPNNVSLKKENRKIIIDFDFLDFEDGAIIQVFHTSRLILDLGTNPSELIAAMNEDGDKFNGYFEDSADQSLNSKEELAGIFNDDDCIIVGKDFQPFFVTGKVIGSQGSIKLGDGRESALIEMASFMTLGGLVAFTFGFIAIAIEFILTFAAEAIGISENNELVSLVTMIAPPVIAIFLIIALVKRFVQDRIKNPKLSDRV